MNSVERLDKRLHDLLSLLNKSPAMRARIAAPRDKTIVYSGGVSTLNGLTRAWQLLTRLKSENPAKYDYVTVEERLRTINVTSFGGTLYDFASNVAQSLQKDGVSDRQQLIVWRALSGIYVQGAIGRVRAFVAPEDRTAKSVFALTEVHVLLRPGVMANIDINRDMLIDFRANVRAGESPTPIIVL